MIRPIPRHAEIGVATNFSFLRGASHPEELVARSAELGLSAIGIADRNTLAGVVRARRHARANIARRSAIFARWRARGWRSPTIRLTSSPSPKTAPPMAAYAGC